MEGEGGILGPVKNFIDGKRLKRAVGRGDVNSVEVLSHKLGLSPDEKDNKLIEAYGVLIARTKKADKDATLYENAKNVILKRKYSSHEGVENI